MGKAPEEEEKEEEKEDEKEATVFKANTVNEVDAERDRATEEEEAVMVENAVQACHHRTRRFRV